MRVPQRSVLGSLLFNIYVSELFHITEMINVCNYPDNNIHFMLMTQTCVGIYWLSGLGKYWPESNMGMQGTKTSCQRHEVIDSDMKLYEYIPKQCEKAERICKFLNLEHKSLLKVFIEPKFFTALLYGCSVEEFQIIASIICMNCTNHRLLATKPRIISPPK